MGKHLSAVVLLMALVSPIRGEEFWDPAASLPRGGAVQIITFNAKGDVFISRSADGVWRSNDHGKTWTRVAFEGRSAWGLAFAPDGDLYAGVQDAGRKFSSVFRSKDAGKTWEQLGKGFAPIHVSSFAFTKSRVLASFGWSHAGMVAVAVSTDGGSTFQANRGKPCYDGKVGTDCFPIRVGGDGAFYTGTENFGVFRSEDEGETWVSIGLPTARANWWDCIAPERGHYLASAQGPDRGVYHSTDGGKTWKRHLADKQCFLMTLSTRGEIFVATNAGVLRTRDEAPLEWTALEGGLEGGSHALAIGPDGHLWSGDMGAPQRSAKPVDEAK